MINRGDLVSETRCFSLASVSMPVVREYASVRATRQNEGLKSHSQTTSSTAVSTFLPAALTLCTLQGCHLLFRLSSQPSPIPGPTSSNRNRRAPRHPQATSCSVSSTTPAAGARNTRTARKTACWACGCSTTLASLPLPEASTALPSAPAG